MANVRLHGETRDTPTALWHTRTAVAASPPTHLFDIATVAQVRASRQFRITLETNRYSVPAHYAGHALTLKTYPDRLCVYQGDMLVARHARQYDRFHDMKTPITPNRCWSNGKKPAIISSSGVFSPSPPRRRRIIASSRSGA